MIETSAVAALLVQMKTNWDVGLTERSPTEGRKPQLRVHFFFRLFFSRALVPFVISPTRRSRRLRCFPQRASAAIRARRVRSSGLEVFAYCRPPRLPRATAAGFFRVELLAGMHRENEVRIAANERRFEANEKRMERLIGTVSQLADLTTQIAEGTARLLHTEAREDRITNLENNRERQ